MIVNLIEIKLFTRLKLGFCHPHEHKFRIILELEIRTSKLELRRKHRNYYLICSPSLPWLLKWNNDTLEQHLKSWRKYSWLKWFPALRDAFFMDLYLTLKDFMPNLEVYETLESYKNWKFIYCAVSTMKWDISTLIRLFFFYLYIGFHLI